MDEIKNTVSIRNLQNRAERLKQAAVKTLNDTLRLLQSNQQRLAQTNRVIAQQLELEREIRFYANCAAFAFADHGRQAINKQDIADTLTYIQKNLDRIPAVAAPSAPFIQVADEGYDSGLDDEELRYRTNANRLAFWIQKGGRHAMPRVQEIITKHPEAMHEEITRSPGREHIHSNN